MGDKFVGVMAKNTNTILSILSSRGPSLAVAENAHSPNQPTLSASRTTLFSFEPFIFVLNIFEDEADAKANLIHDDANNQQLLVIW